jgi:hypothetical protein
MSNAANPGMNDVLNPVTGGYQPSDPNRKTQLRPDETTPKSNSGGNTTNNQSSTPSTTSGSSFTMERAADFEDQSLGGRISQLQTLVNNSSIATSALAERLASMLKDVERGKLGLRARLKINSLLNNVYRIQQNALANEQLSQQLLAEASSSGQEGWRTKIASIREANSKVVSTLYSITNELNNLKKGLSGNAAAADKVSGAARSAVKGAIKKYVVSALLPIAAPLLGILVIGLFLFFIVNNIKQADVVSQLELAWACRDATEQESVNQECLAELGEIANDKALSGDPGADECGGALNPCDET